MVFNYVELHTYSLLVAIIFFSVCGFIALIFELVINYNLKVSQRILEEYKLNYFCMIEQMQAMNRIGNYKEAEQIKKHLKL